MKRYIIEIRRYNGMSGRLYDTFYMNTDGVWPKAVESEELATRILSLDEVASTMHDYGRMEERQRTRVMMEKDAVRDHRYPRADRVLIHEIICDT